MLNLLFIEEVKLSKQSSQDELESIYRNWKSHLRKSRKTFRKLNQKRNHLIDQNQLRDQTTEQDETYEGEYQEFFARRIFLWQ